MTASKILQGVFSLLRRVSQIRLRSNRKADWPPATGAA